MCWCWCCSSLDCFVFISFCMWVFFILSLFSFLFYLFSLNVNSCSCTIHFTLFNNCVTTLKMVSSVVTRNRLLIVWAIALERCRLEDWTTEHWTKQKKINSQPQLYKLYWEFRNLKNRNPEPEFWLESLDLWVELCVSGIPFDDNRHDSITNSNLIFFDSLLFFPVLYFLIS